MIKDIKSIVEDLIAHEYEEEWFEFKVNWNESHALGEYISALSNAAALMGQEYGYFVWGIENNTHNVIGITFNFHQDVKGNEPLQHYLARQTFVHNRWIDGNAPMFTGFQNRMEILSRGGLPPKQTLEGFYAGESVPVNHALSRIFIQLHITEHTGRGVPKITEVYGRENIWFKENSIIVTIPYDRLGDGVYASKNGTGKMIYNTQNEAEIPPVNEKIPPVNEEIPSVNEDYFQVEDVAGMNVEDKILLFCKEPKGTLEIAEFLGYKDKKTIRKYLNPLIEQGRIARTMPDIPNSRFQKYVTIK